MRTDDDITAEVERALTAVEDPELPVSIADLGMVRAVSVSAGSAVVELAPTFLACPALWLVESHVRQAATLVPGVRECRVIWLPGGWSGADVTEAGRRALAGAGLAVPAGDGTVVCPFCGSDDLAETSPFGSAVCRAAAYCRSCRTPVEVLKTKRSRNAGRAAMADGQPDGRLAMPRALADGGEAGRAGAAMPLRNRS